MFLHVRKVQMRIKYRYVTALYKIISLLHSSFKKGRESISVIKTTPNLLSAAKKIVSELVVS